MNSSTTPTAAMADLPRAGFWRRWLATLIDWIIVVIPFQILAAILFAVTAGGIQMNNGFFSVCEPAATVPATLNPPPPHDSNFASVCRISFFGATTGTVLTVARVTRDGNTTTSVRQGYMLDTDGNPINGTSIDGIVGLAFLAYLVGMVWKRGRTFGARIAGVRVVDTAQPGTPGVPLRKTITRYLAMAIGVVPVAALFTYQRIAVGGGADAVFSGSVFDWIKYAAGLAVVWVLVLIYQIALKIDPVYDRLAGTAVVKG